MMEMRRRLDTPDPHPACSHCWCREVSYFDSFEPADPGEMFSLSAVKRVPGKEYDESSFISEGGTQHGS
jgi:hypothetical protein